MNGYNRTLAKAAPEMAGISKISVQSGTSHGGTVLADGSIKDVKLDFNTLEKLGEVARAKYGLSGAVQHGASTLPDNEFDHFPRVETAEIHLATGFQNMLYDHLPDALRSEIYTWLGTHAIEERKANDSDEQFFYKTRKKALGPFKKQLWSLPAATILALEASYDKKFDFLFTQLGVGGTAAYVTQYIKLAPMHRMAPTDGGHSVAAAPDDPDAGE
jgi:fructose-bisphosphate aldolase class II